MLRHPLTFESVTFAYDRMIAPVLSRASFAFPPGWTGVVGANGSGKTTVLKLSAGILRPDSGSIRSPGKAIYCEQRTDEPPGLFTSFLEATDGRAIVLKAALKVASDWGTRWEVLSHGERKRVQISVALWQEPDVLALDEPTNHLDREARRHLVEALKKYRGVGLLVSHDRTLVDSLCRQCLFVESDRIVLRPGGYTAGRSQSDREEASALQRRALLKERCIRLKKQVVHAREDAGRSGRKATKKGLSPRDHDARSRVDMARLTGRDSAVARRAAQLEKRLEQESKSRDQIAVRKQHTLGLWTESERSRRDTIFRLQAGSVGLGEGRRLVFPELTMFPADRIALTGPNGSGKTSLIQVILRDLNVTPERVVYLPQEIEAASSSRTIEQVRALSRDKLGRVMTLVARLGSNPDRLMETTEPSPGEMRKVLLAMGLAGTPQLIILDEPTNHLDLPSIECLEAALSDCSCGLLMVSHDDRFLQALTSIRWENKPCAHERDCMVLTATGGGTDR